jgi:hypothetical protein
MAILKTARLSWRLHIKVVGGEPPVESAALGLCGPAAGMHEASLNQYTLPCSPGEGGAQGGVGATSPRQAVARAALAGAGAVWHSAAAGLPGALQPGRPPAAGARPAAVLRPRPRRQASMHCCACLCAITCPWHETLQYQETCTVLAARDARSHRLSGRYVCRLECNW